MPLQIRRGLEADRVGVIPAAGEPLFTTDDKKLYIGDGVTAGGVAVQGAGGGGVGASLGAPVTWFEFEDFLAFDDSVSSNNFFRANTGGTGVSASNLSRSNFRREFSGQLELQGGTTAGAFSQMTANRDAAYHSIAPDSKLFACTRFSVEQLPNVEGIFNLTLLAETAAPFGTNEGGVGLYADFTPTTGSVNWLISVNTDVGTATTFDTGIPVDRTLGFIYNLELYWEDNLQQVSVSINGATYTTAITPTIETVTTNLTTNTHQLLRAGISSPTANGTEMIVLMDYVGLGVDFSACTGGAARPSFTYF